MTEQDHIRIPPVELDNLTPAQQEVAERITETRGYVAGPFRVLLHVPELTERIQRLGAYLRYDGGLDRDVAELSVLVTARARGCAFEWDAHEPLARSAGVPDNVIRIVRDNADSDSMRPRYRAIVDYVRELAGTDGTSDASYGAAIDLLGVKGIVELTVLVGYYTMLAMSLNAHEPPATDLPDPATVTVSPG